MSKVERQRAKCLILDSGFVEELAALRKVAIAARATIGECKGTGQRFPSLIKALENLDETYQQTLHK